MSGLASTDLNSCPVPLLHGKIGSFPSLTHPHTLCFPVCLRWLKRSPYSLFSCTISDLLQLSQNLNQMTSPTGQIGTCWPTHQASSEYLPPSQPLHIDSCHMLFLRSAIEALDYKMRVLLYAGPIQRLHQCQGSTLSHTKLRKPGETVQSREEKDRCLWCTTAADLLNRCHCSP